MPSVSLPTTHHNRIMDHGHQMLLVSLIATRRGPRFQTWLPEAYSKVWGIDPHRQCLEWEPSGRGLCMRWRLRDKNAEGTLISTLCIPQDHILPYASMANSMPVVAKAPAAIEATWKKLLEDPNTIQNHGHA